MPSETVSKIHLVDLAGSERGMLSLFICFSNMKLDHSLNHAFVPKSKKTASNEDIFLVHIYFQVKINQEIDFDLSFRYFSYRLSLI
jgi:hypothetical protein